MIKQLTNNAKNLKYDGYQGGLAWMVYKCLIESVVVMLLHVQV